MTPKFAKKINGMEMTFILWEKEWNCVVLCSPELGTSFKPYFKNSYEKREFIRTRAKNHGLAYAISKEEVNAVDYCFCYIRPSANEDLIKLIINLKGIIPKHLSAHANPSCPFAY